MSELRDRRAYLAAKLLEQLSETGEKIGQDVIMGAVCAMADFWRETAKKEAAFYKRNEQCFKNADETSRDVLASLIEGFQQMETKSEWIKKSN